jgi:hypothetical protein
MNRICRRAVAAAGALALTGGTALAAAAPASAAPVSDNFSYAASASGLLNIGPVAFAQNSFGQHVVQASHFSLLSNLVTGGSVVDTATSSGASSSVAQVNVRSILAALGLTARIVHTSCSSRNVGPASGGTTIIGGLIGLGGFGAPVDPDPSPNETVHLPGGITVVLNHQTLAGPQLTVDGLFIELPGGEDVTVATSSCAGGLVS